MGAVIRVVLAPEIASSPVAIVRYFLCRVVTLDCVVRDDLPKHQPYLERHWAFGTTGTRSDVVWSH
jgi:hypothetical protein